MIDDLLGRDYDFNGTRLTIVAWDPARGWKLAGRGYAATWVPRAMFRRLLHTGALVPA